MENSPSSFNSRSDEGVKGITVELWGEVDSQAAANVVASFFESTWGDPMPADSWDPDDALRIAQKVMEGKGLPNTLESAVLTFSVNGVSRASTHQLVRTRVGAGFGQQNGSNTNWSDFNFRMPESWQNLEGQQRAYIFGVMDHLNEMYKEAIEHGIPFQDARYMLPMGLQTALVGSYNLLSLKGTLQRRLCNRMLWETNHIARAMADLTVQELPWVGKTLRAGCSRGICQSVSPMFPPSDLVPTQYGLAEWAANNPTLQEEMGPGGDYVWPRSSNGAVLRYEEIDRKRIQNEYDHPEISFSLVDGDTVLAIKDHKGIWRST